MIKITKRYPGTMTKYNLESISEKLIDDITGLFDTLGIDDYEDYDNRIMFSCPVHEGGSPSNSSIMKRDIGNWRCFSEQCHEQYGSGNGASIIQFIQAVLTSQGNETSFYQALSWAANFVGEGKEDDLTTPEDNIRTKFIQLSKYINRKKIETTSVHS